MFENFRSAARNLRAAPGFTLTAVLSLGIGIGGTVCMFTLVKSILLRPLAYRDPDQLVLITQSSPSATSNAPSFGLAPIEFLRWRNEMQSLESLAVMRGGAVNLTRSGPPEMLGAALISAEFFDVLGVKPQLGRWFRREEEKRGMPGVAIISADLWRSHFSEDTNIVGKKIVLDGAPHEVVGVTPPDLRFFRGRQLHRVHDFPERTDIFLPRRFSLVEEQGRFNIGNLGIARLKPGITPAQARAELDSSLPTFHFEPPLQPGWRFWTVVEPLQRSLVGETGKALWLLLLSVGFVLLIACVNVANLSLMRTARRTQELAIRVALGATRRDLLGYSLAESLLLAVVGTAVGVAIAEWITDGVVALAPSRVPRLDEISIDTSVFLFAATICALATLLFGVLPAWRASQVDPQKSLNAAGRGKTETRRGRRVRAALVSAEVTLGTLLAIGSGLLLVSLHNAINAPRGFAGDHVLVADFRLSPDKYQSLDTRQRFFHGLRDQLAATPGVLHLAVATVPPLYTERIAPVETEGSNAAGSSEMKLVAWPAVSSEYFTAMGIPLRDGRFFHEDETDEVAIVSESTARMLWPGENPIGKRVSIPETKGTWVRVVGVAGDVLSAGLDRPSTPAVYRPYSQYGTAAFSLVVRTAAFEDFRQSFRRAVTNVDAEIPVPEIRTISELMEKSTQQRRFQTGLLTAFALTAVLLAAIGVYGVVAYSVAQRTKEIGLRVVLGADPRHVTQLVFRNGMAPVLVGLVGGVGMATLFARAMASLLFNVSTLDPITFIVSPLVLSVAGAVPCWLIARRALRIDPGVCLRVE